MRSQFTYCILQYKHSLILREAVNVAILFYYPANNRLEFVAGNSYRVKSIYPDFDQSVYNSIIKNIESKLKTESNNIFRREITISNFKEIINTVFLPEDSTVLQFTEPITSTNTFDDFNKTIKTYSELLLPGIITSKSETIRHNESFIIKKYYGYIFESPDYLEYKERIENNLRRNQLVKYKGINLRFDFGWKNGTLNLVKPVSFDLKEGQDIQNKSVQYFGYLGLLKGYADSKYRFDLLVAKPQDNSLQDSYNEAVRILKKADSPKKIITEAELPDYSEQTVKNLIKEIN